MTDSGLASARRCIDRIHDRWQSFQETRQRHLGAVSAGLAPAEKVAENILCDLFTNVLDWETQQVRLQDSRVDMTLTRNGMRYVVVEVKRPGSFDGRGSIDRALLQARTYAAQLKVDKVVVSDGGVSRRTTSCRLACVRGRSFISPTTSHPMTCGGLASEGYIALRRRQP